MNQIAQLRGMNIGNGFRAFALRGGGTEDLMDPFLGVEHARMSEATFATHPQPDRTRWIALDCCWQWRGAR